MSQEGGASSRVQRYYTPYEVATHNTPHDCWVSFLGGVYDVTKVIKANPGAGCAPILSAAGKDISHWFDPATGDVRMYVDPATQLTVPYCPQGVFAGVPPMEPTTAWDCSAAVPWWQDASLKVGSLTSHIRLVRIRNVLTEQDDLLEVPSEETVGEIRRRYLTINAHAASYTWRALRSQPRHASQDGAAGGDGGCRRSVGGSSADGAPSCSTLEFVDLDLNRTLDENGVADDGDELEASGLAAQVYAPVLCLYWNDDLTVA